MTLEQLQKEGREHFIKEYCVKRRTQEIRWIRGIFYDDKDQIETTLCEMDRQTANTWKAAQEDVIETLKDYGVQAPRTDSILLSRHDLLLLVQNKQ